MSGIPRPLVRANQLAIVAAVAAALGSGSAWPLALVLGALLTGFVLGPRFHPVFAAARLVLRDRLRGAPPEDAAAQRFNQALAMLLLGASLLARAAGQAGLAAFLALAVGAAALAALCGFCVGCWLYPRLRLAARRRLAR